MMHHVTPGSHRHADSPRYPLGYLGLSASVGPSTDSLCYECVHEGAAASSPTYASDQARMAAYVEGADGSR
jgi:hypothetical protein